MPDLDFSAKLGNGGVSIFDTPQLKLEGKEKARITLFDNSVKMDYTHFIKGTPDGSQKGGQVICLGDRSVLSQKGIDVVGCPACAATAKDENGIGNDAVVSPSRRRYVMYVARYGTPPTSGVPNKPITLALFAWLFTDSKYNSLVDLTKEYGNLQDHDIILTCTAKNWQTFEMMMGNGAPSWTTDAGAKAQYAALLERRSPEVGRMLGRVMTYDAMELMVSSALPNAYDGHGSLESQMERELDSFGAIDDESDAAEPMDLESLLRA